MSSESETILNNNNPQQEQVQEEEIKTNYSQSNTGQKDFVGQQQQQQQQQQQSSSNQEQKQNNNADKFSCRICFDIANEPVITTCGHLYCWQCIFQWSQQKKPELLCPICSNKIELNKCTSIFTGDDKSSTNQEIPRRPQPERTESTYNNQRQNGWNGGEFNFQAFGFPFLFNGFQFNWNAGAGGFPQQNMPQQNNNQNAQQQPRTWKQTMWNVVSILLFIFIFFGPTNLLGWSSDDDYLTNSYLNDYDLYTTSSSSKSNKKKYNSQKKKQYYNYNTGRNPQQNTRRMQTQSSGFSFIDHFSDYSMFYYIGFVLLIFYLPKIQQRLRR